MIYRVSLCRLLAAVVLFVQAASATPRKRGLAVAAPYTCQDTAALNLSDSWYYNWVTFPDVTAAPWVLSQWNIQGKPICAGRNISQEFVPMIWGCRGNCSDPEWPSGLPADYEELWRAAGVRYLLGFNEPDNTAPGQSNITAEDAALWWPQLQDMANRFTPPLELVAPAMTVFDANNQWLLDFFGNCSKVPRCDGDAISHLAFHDYSGGDLSVKADAVARRWPGRKIWITEFSAGKGHWQRSAQEAWMASTVPKLEEHPAVFRYAWFGMRNDPQPWVGVDNLLPLYEGGSLANLSAVPTSTGKLYATLP